MQADLLHKRLQAQSEGLLERNASDVETALYTTDPYTICLGCKVAGTAQTRQFADRLFTLGLADTLEPDIPSMAIWALGQIGGPDVDRIWKANASENDPNKRRAAADLLGFIHTSEAITTLAKL